LALVKATKCHDSKVPTVTFCRSLYHIWGNGVVKHPNIPVFQKEIYEKSRLGQPITSYLKRALSASRQ